jgi:hypothetical protein
MLMLCTTDMSQASVIKSDWAHLDLVEGICELQVCLGCGQVAFYLHGLHLLGRDAISVRHPIDGLQPHKESAMTVEHAVLLKS